jgi:hypothetical protein
MLDPNEQRYIADVVGLRAHVRERVSQPVFLTSLVSLQKINFIVLFFTDVVVGQITNSEEKRK